MLNKTMDTEIDLNKAVAEFAQQNIENMFKAGKGLWNDVKEKARLKYKRTYKEYLKNASERLSKSKSFFIRDEPTYIYKFYVPIGISSSKSKLETASYRRLVAINKFSVITGLAGCGKSMLLKHLFLDAIFSKGKVPVFIELRDFNNTEYSLFDLILFSCRSLNFVCESSYLTKALEAGHFAFFLDGFDEISLHIQTSIRADILKFSKQYNDNILVVTSRPDHEFTGWGQFTIYKTEPLTLQKAYGLIEKLPYDHDLKYKFLIDLKESLFEKHRSFLSNPLLLSIMLLTYGQSADIPNKLSVFYNQAYEALFQRHDALKGAYQRDRLTNFDIQDFAKIFSCFSIQTYDKRVFHFSNSDAINYLDKSKNIVNIDFNEQAYLTDCLKAVCLLVEEGIYLTFSHRSFQEYFVAKFICETKPEMQKKLIERFANNILNDNVISLLFEINQELVERLLIRPRLKTIFHNIDLENKVEIAQYTNFIKLVYNEFNYDQQSSDITADITAKSNRNIFDLVHFIINSYKDHINFETDVEETYNPYVNDIINEFFLKPDISTIKTEKLNCNSPFLIRLSKGKNWFSQYLLESLLEINNFLDLKAQTTDKSLSEIFP